MKFALVMGAFSFGGAERVMCSLANHLCLEHDVTLITVIGAKETYPLDERVKRVNGLERRNDMDGIIKLRRLFKAQKPDVVVSFLTHINVAVILATRGLHIPVIVSERNDPARSATSRFRKVLRRLTYPFADGIVFQTEDARNYFPKCIRRRGAVIPNPLFLTESAVHWEKRREEIVSVGRYVPQKRQDMIIRAFATVCRNTPYTLTFYGNGDEKIALEEQVSELGLADRITVSDAVGDLHSRIRYAKVFVMMSEYEGMPNALMEALGLGLACISSDCPCGGPRYLIEDGVNGRLVPVNDQEALERALRELLEAPEAMEGMAGKAVQTREYLSAERIYSQWDNYISRIVKK